MNTLARRISAGLLIFSLVASATATPADLDDPAVLGAFIDGLVKPLMATNGSPSGTVAIAKDGELIFAKGYGYQDVDEQVPVDPERTLFRPGSTSKLFTWMSVMQLVDQGKLDLDADVNTYLETFKIRDTFEEPITLRHIMTHTAGFEDGGLGYLILDDPERIMPLADSMERYQPERVNPPGKQTAYSNYATSLAGLIVSNVSGMPFNDYVERNIFKPLGMQNSTFVEPLPEGLAENMAGSYKLEAGRFVAKPFEIISNFGPAGALSSTATDMVRFGQMILNGGELDGVRIIGADTLDLMLSRAFSHDDRLMGMALGFYEEEHDGVRLVGHGGDTVYFHSYLGVDQAHDLTFFVSFGSSGGSTVRSAFAPAFYDEYFPQEHVRPEPPEGFMERAAKYAGNYGFWRNNFSKIEKAAGLTSSIKIAPTEDDTLLLAFAGKAKQYVEVDENLFRELNPDVPLIAGIKPALLAFQEDGQGNVTGFVMDGLPFMSLRKLPFYSSGSFNLVLLGFAMLVFVGVLLRRFFQRAAIKSQAATDRVAISSAVYAAAANVLVVVSGAIVITIVQDSLFMGIPLLFKLWLVVPIIAFAAGFYLLYRNAQVWLQKQLPGFWARLRFTVVTLCALFMCWFYYYWNILGFQYF